MTVGYSGNMSWGEKALPAALGLFALALPLSIAGANIGWACIAAALAVRAAAKLNVDWRSWRGALTLPLTAYVATAALTALLGVDPGRSARFLHQDLHKLWIYSLLLLALRTDPAGAAVAAPALAAGFAAAALLGVAQAIYALAGEGWLGRAHAFVHPATFGAQMALAAVGAACFALRSPRAGWKWPAWGLFAVTGAALVLSNSRGPLLGCAAGLAVVLAILPDQRRRATLALAAAAALFLSMEVARSDRSLLRELAADAPPSPTGQLMRLHLWRAAWRMGLDHPWSGVGLNNYRGEFRRYYDGAVDGRERDWGSAHNLYLHQFAERGVLGLAALAWLLGAWWFGAWRRARKVPDAWSLWALGSATAFLTLNLTEVALQTEIVWMLAVLTAAWAEARTAER